MLKSKNLLDFTNLFSPNDYEKNDKIILFFSITKKMKKLHCVICEKYKKFDQPEIS